MAAHIVAASEGGPRFDGTIPVAQRRSEPNGIWCCCNCAKAIDDDVVTYTIDQLQMQKERAIATAHRELLRGEVEVREPSGISSDELRSGWLDELRRMRQFSFEAEREWDIARDLHDWDTPFWVARRLQLRRQFGRYHWWASTASLYRRWRGARTSFPTLHGALKPNLHVRERLNRGSSLLASCRSLIQVIDAALQPEAML